MEPIIRIVDLLPEDKNPMTPLVNLDLSQVNVDKK